MSPLIHLFLLILNRCWWCRTCSRCWWYRTCSRCWGYRTCSRCWWIPLWWKLWRQGPSIFFCNCSVELLCLYLLSYGVVPYGVGTGTLPGAKPLKPPGTACVCVSEWTSYNMNCKCRHPLCLAHSNLHKKAHSYIVLFCCSRWRWSRSRRWNRNPSDSRRISRSQCVLLFKWKINYLKHFSYFSLES